MPLLSAWYYLYILIFPCHRTPEVKPRQHNLASEDRNSPRNTSVVHTALPTPPVDDMEPQSISFIGEPHPQGSYCFTYILLGVLVKVNFRLWSTV